MKILNLVILMACLGPGAPAHAGLRTCQERLVDVAPAFDPEVRLDADSMSVTYRDSTFRLRYREYLVLQLILEDPRETISYGDLIASFSAEGEEPPTLATIWALRSSIQKNFEAVDPSFDRLRTARGHGLYWARADHEKIRFDRVAVARYIFEGYVDGRVIPLSPLQHAILLALLTEDLVDAGTVGASSGNTFSVVAHGLNQKFEPLLGQRLFDGGPKGLGAIQLRRTPRPVVETKRPRFDF